jgi:hypothetical protein
MHTNQKTDELNRKCLFEPEIDELKQKQADSVLRPSLLYGGCTGPYGTVLMVTSNQKLSVCAMLVAT